MFSLLRLRNVACASLEFGFFPSGREGTLPVLVFVCEAHPLAKTNKMAQPARVSKQNREFYPK